MNAALAVATRPQASFTLAFPANAEQIAPIRRSIVSLAEIAGVSDDELGDIALAVSEALTNAVMHAFTGRPGGTVTVSAEVAGDELEVVVQDNGSGMRPRTDSPGLGLGLPIIAQVTTAVDVRKGSGDRGTRVCMTFPLQRN
jgi:serine/threonine-protein kinase RsbW